MNPCKCGWFGHYSGRCVCADSSIRRYHERLSGPFLDRLDLFLEAPSLEYDELRGQSVCETSAVIRTRVNTARELQRRRFDGAGIGCNASIGSKQLERYCVLSPECDKLLRSAFARLAMTARSYDRVLRVARTIADLGDSVDISPGHLAEAIQYRRVRFFDK